MLCIKSFIATCIACWLITLGAAAYIVLGIVGVIHANIWAILSMALFFLVMLLASYVCLATLREEISERRDRRDNRKRS